MIYLMLTEGFEEVEAIGTADMLRRGGLDLKLVGVSGKTVTGKHGITVVSDISPAEMTEKMDLLILPGGDPGAANLDAWEGMDALLARAEQEHSRIAAICAAPMILGKRGYLKDRYAVCYPGFEKYLLGAKRTEGRVVTDGPYTTAIGMGATQEFGAELVSCLLGIDRAAEIYTAIQGK